MHFFSVGAIFRNEAHCIEEWIEHYLHHGADHFYLIDDDSTDDSVALLMPYLDNITLYHSTEPQPHPLGFQRNSYNRYILPHVARRETQWILMCDLDEFAYSPLHGSIPEFLRQGSHLAQIQVRPTLFGSNGHDTQPSSLVQGFTWRTALAPSPSGGYKYFVNSMCCSYESLNIHHATPSDPLYLEPQYFIIVDPPHIRLNHYICQSREFWIQVKCSRGDADGYLQRDMELFQHYDKDSNETEDTELASLNRHLMPLASTSVNQSR